MRPFTLQIVLPKMERWLFLPPLEVVLPIKKALFRFSWNATIHRDFRVTLLFEADC